MDISLPLRPNEKLAIDEQTLDRAQQPPWPRGDPGQHAYAAARSASCVTRFISVSLKSECSFRFAEPSVSQIAGGRVHDLVEEDLCDFARPKELVLRQARAARSRVVPADVTARRVRARHCHHEKIVVMDDRVAFVGGIDLTTYAGDRYDTLEPHRLAHECEVRRHELAGEMDV